MGKYLLFFLYFFVALYLVNGVVYQCQNEIIEINCPYREEINITNAFYGNNNSTQCKKNNMTEPNCSFENATLIVAEKCNNKRSCTVYVNSTVFGDSCPGNSTYLEVNFTCNPKKMEVSQCQNEIIEISCPFREEIDITNAYYGNNNSTQCRKDNRTEPNCSFENATLVVAEKCNNRRSCTISVNSTVFGDSCPGNSTYLEVDFTCKPIKRCGRFEHLERGVCDCNQFCKSDIRCFPTCPFQDTCVCNEGYKRDTITNQCVLAYYCPIDGDPKRNHEEFCECASRQRTCKHPWAFIYFHYSCQPGYACIDGYIRDSATQNCVKEGQCPYPARWK